MDVARLDALPEDQFAAAVAPLFEGAPRFLHRLAWARPVPTPASGPRVESRPASVGILRSLRRAGPRTSSIDVTPASGSTGSSLGLPAPSRLIPRAPGGRPRPPAAARDITAAGRPLGRLAHGRPLDELGRTRSTSPGSLLVRPARRNRSVALRRWSDPGTGGHTTARRSRAWRVSDAIAMSGRSRPRIDLALPGDTRSGPRRDGRVTPVRTVYRREQQPAPTAPAPAPAPEVRPSAPQPAIDIDRLDRELWRRFEKRARTERERHGRA